MHGPRKVKTNAPGIVHSALSVSGRGGTGLVWSLTFPDNPSRIRWGVSVPTVPICQEIPRFSAPEALPEDDDVGVELGLLSSFPLWSLFRRLGQLESISSQIPAALTWCEWGSLKNSPIYLSPLPLTLTSPKKENSHFCLPVERPSRGCSGLRRTCLRR